jgi:type IX secretion system substrate protein
LPNPTNGVSTLRFGVTAVEKVMVNLYSADGRLVKTITNRIYSPGNYTLPVEYTGLQKGVYFITINNGAKRTVLQNMFVR